MINVCLKNLKKNKEDLDKNGFCVFKQALSGELLNYVEKEVLRFSWSNIGKEEVNVIKTENKCILSSSHNLVDKIRIFELFYENDYFLNFFEYALGKKPNINDRINSSYFFKSRQSQEIKLHQDNAYFNLEDGINCLTFYIPVHKQNKKYGTIFYFSGSHLLGDLDHVPEGNIGASMCLENLKDLKNLRKHKVIYLDLAPGDIVVHNALVVHGTLGNPLNVLCEAFNFTLFGEFNKQNIIKYKKYKNNLKKFLLKKL